jgi:hypothetical protein
MAMRRSRWGTPGFSIGGCRGLAESSYTVTVSGEEGPIPVRVRGRGTVKPLVARLISESWPWGRQR